MKKIFKVLSLRQFTWELFRERHLSKSPCRVMGVDPAPGQIGMAVSDEQLTKWTFLRSLYLRGDSPSQDIENGINLHFRLNPNLNGVEMKDQNTQGTQFMKIVKQNNVKGVLVGINEPKFKESVARSEYFVNNMMVEESEDFEQVLCAYINERNTTNNGKKFVRAFAKLLEILVDGPFETSSLRKEMIDSASAGNMMEHYYHFIKAARIMLFSEEFMKLDKNDSEWLSLLPEDSFSWADGKKGPRRIQLPVDDEDLKSNNPWEGLYSSFLAKKK